MADEISSTEDLGHELEQLSSAQPHLENLLKAFGPVLLEKTQWLSDLAADPQILTLDPQRFAEGITVNRQHPLFTADDPWGSGGWSVAKAISQGFPNLAHDMEALLAGLTEGRLDCYTLFFADNRETDGGLSEKAEELGISPVALHLFLRLLNRFMLSKKARDMQTELAAHVWKKGYCPVCGGFPHLAILGDNGRRSLHCSDCGHAWNFARLTCPYCDHEDPQNTTVFFIDGEQTDSAFTCDKCRRYLLTANRSASLRILPADLIAMSLVHLDVILQEKGYSPMAVCEWNSFNGDEEEEQGPL